MFFWFCLFIYFLASLGLVAVCRLLQLWCAAPHCGGVSRPHRLEGWRAPWLWLLGSRAQAHCLAVHGVFPDLGSNASALHWQVGS